MVSILDFVRGGRIDSRRMPIALTIVHLNGVFIILLWVHWICWVLRSTSHHAVLKIGHLHRVRRYRVHGSICGHILRRLLKSFIQSRGIKIGANTALTWLDTMSRLRMQFKLLWLLCHALSLSLQLLLFHSRILVSSPNHPDDLHLHPLPLDGRFSMGVGLLPT